MVFADASDEFYEAVGDSIGAGGAARAQGARDGSPGAPSSCTGVAPPATRCVPLRRTGPCRGGEKIQLLF